MSAPVYDILAIGNAIVDAIATANEAFLLHHDIRKGAMQLIDEAQAERLYAAMNQATIISGGSAANTVVGASMLGAKTGFLGKVRNDELGRLFAHDIQAAGVTFPSSHATEGPATARSLILVTPDGERSMNTYLGACREFTPADIDENTISSAKIIYLEGYLWDPPEAKEAFRKAIRIAKTKGRHIALTLSDSFCVDRWREEFLALIQIGDIDILFANIHELKSLYQTGDETTAITALKQETLRHKNLTCIITRSSKGAMALQNGTVTEVKAQPVERVVDTTGAGDLFAAGCLTGLARHLPLETCLTLGSIAAGEIIQHIGARPQKDLKQLAEQAGISL
jgi:sugar/nucleoside kinase (ribokinase family)